MWTPSRSPSVSRGSRLPSSTPLVGAGRIESIAEFMQLVVRKALINEMLWQETIDRIMEESGGPLTSEEEAWVQSMLAKQREPKPANA